MHTAWDRAAKTYSWEKKNYMPDAHVLQHYTDMYSE